LAHLGAHRQYNLHIWFLRCYKMYLPFSVHENSCTTLVVEAVVEYKYSSNPLHKLIGETRSKGSHFTTPRKAIIFLVT
jgi:hypothetical protein